MSIVRVEYKSSCLICQSPPANTNVCSVCRVVRYCGASCQKSDWKRHKEDCQALSSQGWGAKITELRRTLSSGTGPQGSLTMKLIWASQIGSVAAVRQIIAEQRPLTFDPPGETFALFAAAGFGYIDVLHELVAAGASVNHSTQRTHGRCSSLIAAAYFGFANAVRLLLDAGADVHHLCLDGQGERFSCIEGDTAQSVAARRGHLSVVDILSCHAAQFPKTPVAGKKLYALKCIGHFDEYTQFRVASTFRHYRTMAGDGNSFYRAVYFTLLEELTKNVILLTDEGDMAGAEAAKALLVGLFDKLLLAVTGTGTGAGAGAGAGTGTGAGAGAARDEEKLTAVRLRLLRHIERVLADDSSKNNPGLLLQKMITSDLLVDELLCYASRKLVAGYLTGLEAGDSGSSEVTLFTFLVESKYGMSIEQYVEEMVLVEGNEADEEIVCRCCSAAFEARVFVWKLDLAADHRLECINVVEEEDGVRGENGEPLSLAPAPSPAPYRFGEVHLMLTDPQTPLTHTHTHTPGQPSAQGRRRHFDALYLPTQSETAGEGEREGGRGREREGEGEVGQAVVEAPVSQSTSTLQRVNAELRRHPTAVAAAVAATATATAAATGATPATADTAVTAATPAASTALPISLLSDATAALPAPAPTGNSEAEAVHSAIEDAD